MGKYAVVMGINYVNNPEAALKGCCNDARLIVDMLHRKGFEDDDIKILVDDDDSYQVPNHINVKNALNWLCQDREPGDVIFCHFSGHGTQVPADDDDVEEDNLDECIVLDELFLMADDDLKQFFSQLPSGAMCTVITDCCHSGTMLDGTEVVIEGDKDGGEGGEPIPESSELLETLGGCRGVDEEVSTLRSLPIDTICQVMSAKLGSDVPPTASGVNGAMAQVFGGDAGKLMLKFAMSQLSKHDGGGSGGSGLTSLLGSFLGGSKPAAPPPSSNPLGALLGGGGGGGAGGALGGLMSAFGGGGGASTTSTSHSSSGDPMAMLGGMLGGMGLQGTPKNASSSAPKYNPQHKALEEDVCTLITGCQADETSADVRPASGGAYGALTKTLTDVEKQNENISYYDLVSKVRHVLSDGGFHQNPCLETSQSRAREVFICEV